MKIKDPFAQFNEQIKQQEANWEEIEKLAKILEERPVQDTQTKLLLLLVNQLKPAVKAEDLKEEVNTLFEGIENLLKEIK